MKNILKRLFIVLVFFGLFMLVGCGTTPADQDKKDDEKEDKPSTEPTLVIQDTDITLNPKEEYLIDYSILNGYEVESLFTSSDSKIADVDEAGYIVGKKGGKAVVTVTITIEDGTILTKDVNVTVGIIVTLNPGTGATCEITSFVLKDDEPYTLPIPTKEHAYFQGWLPTGAKDYVTEVKATDNITSLRAVWKNEYLLKYELNGGTYKDGNEYVVEGTTVELGTPIKEGNKFLGWGMSKNSVSYVSSLNINSNCTLYAIWEPSRIDVVFETNDGTYTGPKYALYGGDLALGIPHKFGYTFLGWTLTPTGTDYVSTLTNITKATTLYAQWDEGNTNEDFMVTNLPENGIPYTESLKLQLAYSKTSMKTAKVTYASSNSKIFTVSSTGEIETLKCGVATLTITVKATTTIVQEVEIVVYIPGRFDVSYETASYVEEGKSIKLNAQYYNREEAELEVLFRSDSESIATVTQDGTVTGVKAGLATIVAYVKNDPTLYFEFVVTVLDSNVSDAVRLILDSHESNVFIRYELGIGAGGPAYYKDIIGSVSDLLLTEDYVVNRKWEASQAAVSSNHGGKMSSVEFICVHYTGNMSRGADGNANASYFATGGGGTSIHYTTGNDGIFSCLDDTLVGFHAGDGTGTTFKWYATGVMVKASDPEVPVFEISSNSKYIINGTETKCDVPAGTTPATARVTGNTFTYNGVEQPCINNMGLSWKVVDGQYYMGTTYWCYSQVSAGRICNHGGNNNSIGIESCVNEGSDLWQTWHYTAQLVAHLMVDNKLDITRVKGHHFFSAKNCPQPMLENNLEIWNKFIELVEAEYKLITKFSGYKFEYTGLSGIAANSERATQAGSAKLITYKVKITKGTTVEEITLASAINGVYGKTY